MKPEAQRIAIAEACGYSAVSFDDRQHVDIDSRSIQMWTQWMGEKQGVRIQVPAYVTDLNAMHEAEKLLKNIDRYQLGIALCGILKIETEGGMDVVDIYYACHATAAQRAEAFLRTIGKWEASK